MLQTIHGQSTQNRMKGTLCFSSNFRAVIFVRDVDSDARALNWNSLTDLAVFERFKRSFALRSTRVENSFYVDADASEVARFIEQHHDGGGSNELNFSGYAVGNSTTRPVRIGVSDISSIAFIPLEWRNTPIEVFIKSVNFRLTNSVPQNKLCLITCESHNSDLGNDFSNLEITEVVKGSFRDASAQSILELLNARGIKHAVLLGHVGCGLAPRSRASAEIFDALVNEGWSPEAAQEYLAPRFPVFDGVSTLRNDYKLISGLCKSVMVAPLFINHNTRSLQLPTWYASLSANDLELATSDRLGN